MLNIINVSQVKEIRDKIESTCEERYGSKSYLSSDDFKNKTRDTWSFDGHDGPCSRQQKYIANLVNGKINEAITGYWTDIYIEKENVIIEYDGSGHRVNLKYNEISEKDFNNKQRKRYFYLKSKGYKLFRIINENNKDKLPSDDILLHMKEIAF